ncbi:MAG: ABC transporter permease [Candidatus Gygaella obscura]|nr:ABC transporter permease [Candidatus Gygaella obscura]
MIRFIIKRLLGLLPLLLGITLISFFVIHLAPGEPTVLQEAMNPKVSLEVHSRLVKLYDLDKPLSLQYINWLSRVARFDFGTSFIDGRPVIEKIARRLPLTLFINITSMLLIFLIALPLGIISAVKKNSFFDRSVTVFVFIGFAIPTFWLALLLMDFLGVKLGVLPVVGLKSIDFEYFTPVQKILDLVKHLVLPIVLSAFSGLAGMSRYMRTSMVNVLKSPYIYTAKAKGLPQSQVVFKHALRNAVLPIVTILGLSIPALIGGSVIFETIFSLPGMGRLFYEAVMQRDYSMIMASLVIGAFLTLIGNLLADIAYAYVDPRIRYAKQ